MFKTIKTIGQSCIFIFLLSMLTACGGSDGGDNNPEPSPSTSPTPDPTPDPTPSPDPSPLVTPLEKGSTNIGETFVGAGLVAVLTENEGAFEVSVEDKSDMTLYVWDSDPVGESACNATNCVSSWPPLLAIEGAQATPPLSIIEREDGNNQWALRDKPLYFFSGDSAPGDINGEGLNGWRVAVSQPVMLSNLEAQGDFFVSYGETLVTAPESEGVTDSFVSQRQNLSGMTLYTFDNDEPGVSNCFGGCLANWPALLADPEDTAHPPFSLIERQMNTEGGTAMQWAYQGKPLYYFDGDSAPGDVNGLAIPNWPLARPLPWTVSDSSIGSIFTATGLVIQAVDDNGEEVTESVAKDGFTLYTFDTDEAGVSNCSGGCLSSWPALIAHAGAVAGGPFSLVERESGAMQWALNGMPLYFYIGDTSAGQVNGDEVSGVWHAARTAPVAVDTHPDEGALFIAHGNLVNEDGNPDNTFADFTLYTFAEDDPGVSTCYNSCADTWPPLFAPENASDFGDFTVIVRDDPDTSDDDALNIKQWAYKGEPLYFFIGDTNPGDVSGEYGTWFIARP